MTITIECPHCGQRVSVDESHAGQTGTCPSCDQPVTVPGPAATPKSADLPNLPTLPNLQSRLDQTIKTAANAWQKFLGEDQDSAVVSKVHERAMALCTADEEIKYIAVQKKPVVTISPDAIMMTTRRLLIFRSKLMSMTFEDYPWRDIRDVHFEEGVFGAKFFIDLLNGQHIEVDYLPKAQARKLYQFGQEMEERMHHQRRQKAMEDQRVANGGLPLSSSPFGMGAVHDPMQKLQQLKGLRDQGLISEAEYEAKRAEIVSRL